MFKCDVYSRTFLIYEIYYALVRDVSDIYKAVPFLFIDWFEILTVKSFLPIILFS